MDADEFRRRGKEMVDFVADYLENIRDRRVYPTVKPGYLQDMIPNEAPIDGERWDDVMSDVERVIMPGVTHWHHPNFHAYFPTANSYPSICADMLSDAIGCIGFSWAASPACTELESVVMDWLGKMLKLPDAFLASGSEGKGGGVIQGTASEATVIGLLAARSKTIKEHIEKDPSLSSSDIMGKLVGYCSEQAHSSVERAGMIGMVKIIKIESDDKHSMKPEALECAIQKDIAEGRIPFFCCATLGTTASCAYDKLTDVGPICNKYGVWLHVDAAYAGSAFICPEYRHLLDGVEFADTFNFNPHKWLMVAFDCSAMWIKNSEYLVDSFNVDPLYLKHAHQGNTLDYRHWQIPLGRRFRSLKLWFVLRSFGVRGLQEIVRKHVALAKDFEALVRSNQKFEIVAEVTLGLVCFRLKSTNEVNETLYKQINEDGRIHLVPSKIKDIYFLRFAVCATRTEAMDVTFAWDVITEIASKIVSNNNAKIS